MERLKGGQVAEVYITIHFLNNAQASCVNYLCEDWIARGGDSS